MVAGLPTDTVTAKATATETEERSTPTYSRSGQ
jgi:hypothetical protein